MAGLDQDYDDIDTEELPALGTGAMGPDEDYDYSAPLPDYTPDLSGPISTLRRMRDLADSYTSGIDYDKVFDQIKQSKLAALREARKAYQVPSDRSNLPLMMFGAQLMKPTLTGRMGEAIGSGIEAMIPEIRLQRAGEDIRRKGLADIDSLEAGLEGDELYDRLSQGSKLLAESDKAELEIYKLMQTGQWKNLDAQTRANLAQIAAQSRVDAAHISAGARDQRALSQTVRDAASQARMEGQAQIQMGYAIPPDQYSAWVTNRTKEIMAEWGYTEDDYKRAVSPYSPVAPGGGVEEIDPEDPEADLRRAIEEEDAATGQAPPVGGTSGAPGPGAAPAAPLAPGAAPGAALAPGDTLPGGWSKQTKPLSATETKIVDEADTNIQNLLITEDALSQALKLNDQAYSGALANEITWLDTNLDWLPWYDTDDRSRATSDFNNLILQQVASSLKSTFGAMPTEGERQFLVQLQASVEKDPKVREGIIKRALEFTRLRREFNQWKSDAIRQGQYRNQSYVDFLRASSDPIAKRILMGGQ